jgi:hypothetical protein
MKKFFVDFADMMIVLGPVIICFLIFCFCKYKKQKQIIYSVLKYGIWIGSGEKIEY